MQRQCAEQLLKHLCNTSVKPCKQQMFILSPCPAARLRADFTHCWPMTLSSTDRFHGSVSIFSGAMNATLRRIIRTVTTAWPLKRCYPVFLFLQPTSTAYVLETPMPAKRQKIMPAICAGSLALQTAICPVLIVFCWEWEPMVIRPLSFPIPRRSVNKSVWWWPTGLKNLIRFG